MTIPWKDSPAAPGVCALRVLAGPENPDNSNHPDDRKKHLSIEVCP
jgi:hypothetical protein